MTSIYGRYRYNCTVAFLISTIISTAQLYVIADPYPSVIRCSHAPSSIDSVNYVLLNDGNYSADLENHELKPQDPNISGSKPTLSKTKRQIGWIPNHLRKKLGSNSNIFQEIPGSELVPMKIKVHYDSSTYLLEPSKLKLITETVLPSVISFFEGALLIRKDYTIDTFRIIRRCPNNTLYHVKGISGSFCKERCEDYAVCGEMIVPPEHLAACSYCNTTSRRCITDYESESRGVAQTQLLLYVSAKQTSRCKKDQTIAYAAHCAQDSLTDRPIAGHANLCPSSISTDPRDLKALIATVKHELTHVLGFSVSLFAYYRDEFGNPLTERESALGPMRIDSNTGYAKWSDRIIKRVIRKNWVTGAGLVDKEVHLMVTPTVKREARNHFNCSTLEGAELEDQGSDGTSLTHWEKRLFENEAMTGTHTQNSVFSRLTLAALQDTGWYVANFSWADQLEWGNKLGCDFAKKSCKSWIDERRSRGLSVRPFCDRVKGDLLQISCTEDRTSKAVCNMKHYNQPLPPTYQNFNHLDGISKDNLSHYGGSVDLADYCPFIQEFTWQAQNVTIRGSRCDLEVNNLDTERNAALESYGPGSRCFEHARRWEQRSCIFKRHWHHTGAGCYKYSCFDGHFAINIGNRSYSCFYPDQIISVELVVDRWFYNGSIVCPACERVCPSQKCKSYDQSIINKILQSSSGVRRDEYVSKDSLNFPNYDTNSVFNDEEAAHEKPLTKHDKLRSRFNKSVKLPIGLGPKEYVALSLELVSQPDKDMLVCSSAESLIVKNQLIVTCMIISVLALIRTLRNEARF